jgi:hypothetical protein
VYTLLTCYNTVLNMDFVQYLQEIINDFTDD